MGQDGQIYAVGQHITGKVKKLLPYGLFVCLADGTQAYIRRRELTWSGNIDPRKLWQVGDKVEAVVLKPAGSGHNMELSCRAASPDPWDEFGAKFRQGDVVEGTVKNLMEYGVFVEIRPGVDGLIPLSQLAPWPVQEPEEIVWVDDLVEAQITYLDCRAKKLRLSIRARMHQQEVVAGIMEDFGLYSQAEVPTDEPNQLETADGAAGKPPKDSPSDPAITPLNLERLGCILVIDDHDEIRLPLVEWLQHQGCEVDEAKDADEAGRKVLKKSYDLLFIDLNLPGTNGLAFLQQIRQRDINCQAAMMTTADRLAEHSHELEEIGVIDVFVKPLDLDEIEQVLIRLGQGKALPRWHRTPHTTQPKTPKSFQQLATAVQSKISLADRFRVGLEQLVAFTPAEAGLIFWLDPISRAVSIMARFGQITLHQEAIHTLGASPVRDVIEEGDQILENHMSGQTKVRFSKLLALLPFEACLGIPLEAGGATHHALFLFNRQPGVFSRYHLRDALAAGALFSAAIERKALEQQFRSLNKTLLSGQLAGGFSHEVYNKMSGLELQLRNLQMDCRSFGRRPDKSIHFNEIQRATNSLAIAFNDLKDTVGTFQQLMHAEKEQQVDINETIQKTIALLRPVLQEQRIKIETELSHNLPDLISNSIQLQQVFLNIVLNATQHMILKIGRGKMLNITTLYQAHDQTHPIKIRFSDTGPGIHRRLWGKIFDLGFTNRPGGTGQGLYIARSLIEALDGKIRIERSPIMIGTTFLVELPLSTTLLGETR